VSASRDSGSAVTGISPRPSVLCVIVDDSFELSRTIACTHHVFPCLLVVALSRISVEAGYLQRNFVFTRRHQSNREGIQEPATAHPAMSKRAAKSASSARAASTFGSAAFGASPAAAFSVASTQLSYVSEPPDLSGISDPNVVVYFRNLSKRDSTTKAKALEDIQAHISKEDSAEEGLLEAWVCSVPIFMYARSNESGFTGQNLPSHLD
jgi:hypothetical protein